MASNLQCILIMEATRKHSAEVIADSMSDSVAPWAVRSYAEELKVSMATREAIAGKHLATMQAEGYVLAHTDNGWQIDFTLTH